MFFTTSERRISSIPSLTKSVFQRSGSISLSQGLRGAKHLAIWRHDLQLAVGQTQPRIRFELLDQSFKECGFCRIIRLRNPHIFSTGFGQPFAPLLECRAAVLRIGNEAGPAFLARKFLQNCAAAIGGSIIQQDDFHVLIGLPCDGTQPLRQIFFVIVIRDDDADERLLRASLCGRGCRLRLLGQPIKQGFDLQSGAGAAVPFHDALPPFRPLDAAQLCVASEPQDGLRSRITSS